MIASNQYTEDPAFRAKSSFDLGDGCGAGAIVLLEEFKDVFRTADQARAEPGQDAATGLLMIDRLRQIREENRRQHSQLSALRDAREIASLDHQLLGIDRLITDLTRKCDLAKVHHGEAEAVCLALEHLVISSNDAALRDWLGGIAGELRGRWRIQAEGPTGPLTKCAWGADARRSWADEALLQVENLLVKTSCGDLCETLNRVAHRLRWA